MVAVVRLFTVPTSTEPATPPPSATPAAPLTLNRSKSLRASTRTSWAALRVVAWLMSARAPMPAVVSEDTLLKLTAPATPA
jgi:hypothetical protein